MKEWRVKESQCQWVKKFPDRLALQFERENYSNSKMDAIESIHICLEADAHEEGQCFDTTAVIENKLRRKRKKKKT